MSFYNINHIFFLFLYFSFCEREKREIYAESTTSPAKCSFSFARIFGPREYANSCFITASKYIMCKKVVSVRFFSSFLAMFVYYGWANNIFFGHITHKNEFQYMYLFYIHIPIYLYVYEKKYAYTRFGYAFAFWVRPHGYRNSGKFTSTRRNMAA